MATTLDEFLIKLGVDADEAKKAGDAIDQLVDKIEKVPQHAEPPLKVLAEHFKKHVGEAIKDIKKEVSEFITETAKGAVEAPFKVFEAVAKHTEKIDKAAKQARAAGLELEEFGKLAFLG